MSSPSAPGEKRLVIAEIVMKWLENLHKVLEEENKDEYAKRLNQNYEDLNHTINIALLNSEMSRDINERRWIDGKPLEAFLKGINELEACFDAAAEDGGGSGGDEKY